MSFISRRKNADAIMAQRVCGWSKGLGSLEI
jgi:hypothetical protein